MKYIITYEKFYNTDLEFKNWLVVIDDYFEASLRKIGMDRDEAHIWLNNFTQGVSKPKTNRILVGYRYGGFSWNDAPEEFEEVHLTQEEKDKYDMEKNANKYNL